MTELYDIDDHPEHKAQQEMWNKKWIENTLSTEPANKPLMIEAINGLYTAANFKVPKYISFVKSPIAAYFVAGIADGLWAIRDDTDGLPKSLEGWENGLFSTVSELVRELTVETLRICGNVVKDDVVQTIYEEVLTSLKEVFPELPNEKDGKVHRGLKYTLQLFIERAENMHDGGSDWSEYAQAISFFDRIAGLDLPVYEKWRCYELATLNGASRMMHSRFCVVSDRQSEVHVDENHDPHNDKGPARAWSDGFKVWYYHGTEVTEEIILGHFGIEDVFEEENTEVRRCMIEIMGWDAFLEGGYLNLIDGPVPDPGNHPYTLSLYDVPNEVYGEAVNVLICTNGSQEVDGTRRKYGLTVPDTIVSALEASAWMANDDDHPVKVSKEDLLQVKRRH